MRQQGARRRSVSGGFIVTLPSATGARAGLPLVGLLLLALTPLAGCGKSEPKAAQRPPVQVSVMTVSAQEIPYTQSFVAQTESSKQVDIVSRVSGFLDRIAYREGEVVKAGQILFQLDPKPFQAQLDAAKGELMAQKARFSTASANLKRVKPLAQQDALSQADLDRAQGDFDAANAAVYAAGAKVREAEINLGYTTIRSPVNGMASRSSQRQGAFINAMADSAKLTYVAAIDPIWVNFSVSQNQIARLGELVSSEQVVAPKDRKYEIELIMPDGSTYPERGRIDFADPSFSQNTGSFLVRAVIANPRNALRPGMFVTANVGGAVRPSAIIVPQLAVQQGSSGHLVYVVNPSGVAEVRPVVVGDYHGEKDIVIVSGLKAGDRVVVEGALKVVPGQPVKIAEAGAKPVAAGPPASPPPEKPAQEHKK
jgi:membrane fusion protein, multidrug efflux system